MKQSEAWLAQAAADLAAGEKLFEQVDPTSYCQAIAKYQQTVEKSVKAMVAAVNDLGSNLAITTNHQPITEIDGLLALRRVIDNASTQHLARIFGLHRQAIEELCRFAPRWPEDGINFARNTEYPFLLDAKWTAPVVAGSFTLQETKRAQLTARAIRKAADDFAVGVNLGPSRRQEKIKR